MNFRLVITFFLFSIIGISQTKGTISGTLTDKDLNNDLETSKFVYGHLLEIASQHKLHQTSVNTLNANTKNFFIKFRSSIRVI